jgi:hypothetical protein
MNRYIPKSHLNMTITERIGRSLPSALRKPTALVGAISSVLMISSSTLSAQVSTYTFSKLASTYAPISSGTVLIQGANWNDHVFTITPSTPVWFNGAQYPSLYVSCNGFITVGSAPLESNFTPISSKSAYAGAISPFGANLWDANLPTSAVLWKEQGGELIVEWRDVRRRLTSSNERFSFQVRYSRSDASFNFVYSTITGLAPSLLQQPQIGLRGSTNFYPTNICNREVGTANAWGNSTSGAGIGAVCRFTSKTPARQPSAGMVYRFAPRGVLLDVTTDQNGAQTSWVIVPLAGGPAVCSGSGYPNSSTVTRFCPITSGNYKLVVLDAAGDGMCCTHGIGGYLLRTTDDKRIIDNRNDGTFTDSSRVSAGFTLPIGTDHIVDWRCDQLNAVPSDYIQVAPDPAVSAEYTAPDNGDDGYEYWFFNPDGGYSRRVFFSPVHSCTSTISGRPHCR